MIKKYFSLIANITKVVFAILLVYLAFTSISKWAPICSSVETHRESIEYLNEKRSNVILLSTASTSSSAALTLLPDDWGIPIANELAELSIYFIIISTAITLEKYLLTLSGLITFKYLLPISFAMIALHLFLSIFFDNVEWIKRIAVKIGAFALALYFLVPTSIGICKFIEDTYDTSIQSAIESTENLTKITQESNKISLKKIGNFFLGIKDTTNKAVLSVKNILNNFIDAISIMLITSCLVPILIIISFILLIKLITNINISLPTRRIKIDTKKIKDSFTHNT